MHERTDRPSMKPRKKSRTSYMKLNKVPVCLVAALLFLVIARPLTAGNPFEKIRDSARRATDNAQRSWNRSQPQRESVVRRAQESVSKAADNARRSWDQSRPQREDVVRRAQEGVGKVADNAKRSWEQSRSQREDVVRRAQEGVGKAADNAKRTWEQSRPQREEAVRQIQDGARQAAESVTSQWDQSRPQREQIVNNLRDSMRTAAITTQEKWESSRGQREAILQHVRSSWEANRSNREEFMKNVSERAAVIMSQNGQQAQRIIQQAARTYGPRLTLMITEGYEKHGEAFGDAVATAFERQAPEIAAAVRDPHDTEKVLCAAVAIAQMRQESDQLKKQTTYTALSAVGELKIDGPYGRTTLSALSRQWVSQSVPALAGSSIASDPAEFVTYGLIYQDTDYFFREMKIVDSKTGTGKVSMQTALIEASPVNPADAESILTIMGDCEQLSNSAASGDGISASADAFCLALDLHARNGKR